jgi:hypothetical protein
VAEIPSIISNAYYYGLSEGKNNNQIIESLSLVQGDESLCCSHHIHRALVTSSPPVQLEQLSIKQMSQADVR